MLWARSLDLHKQIALQAQPPSATTGTHSHCETCHTSALRFLGVVTANHHPVTEQCTRLWSYEAVDSHSLRIGMSVHSGSQSPAHHQNNSTVKQMLCYSAPERTMQDNKLDSPSPAIAFAKGVLSSPRLIYFHAMCYATSLFVWLESYDVSRSLRHERAPQSNCRHGLPQRRGSCRGEGNSVSCHGENGCRYHDICVDRNAVYGGTPGVCMSGDCSGEPA